MTVYLKRVLVVHTVTLKKIRLSDTMHMDEFTAQESMEVRGISSFLPMNNDTKPFR